MSDLFWIAFHRAPEHVRNCHAQKNDETAYGPPWKYCSNVQISRRVFSYGAVAARQQHLGRHNDLEIGADGGGAGELFAGSVYSLAGGAGVEGRRC